MINSIIHWSINNRILVLWAAAMLIVAGLYALRETPVDAIPDLSDVQVIIKTSYPGQAPQVVQDQVTYPLTTAMLAVPKAVTVRGYSFLGDSYVYVIFEDGTDLYWARSRVLEYLNQISDQLPVGAKPELGPDATGVGWVYQYALIDRSGRHSLDELRTLQDWFLTFELQTLPGVAEIATVGGMVKQYQVIVDPNKLRAYNISLDRIRSAIQRANQEAGASVIEIAEAEYTVRSSGYLQSVMDLQQIPLGLNEQGTALLLSHVADIVEGPQMRRGVTDLNGEGEAVSGIVVMRSGENAQHVIAAVKAKLAELARSLPAGVDIVEVYDRSSLIERALATMQEKLTIELILVALVCAVFLFHWRSSLVIIISLPIGVLCAYIIMVWQGINVNIMSLGGIALAIGAMVDGAIVMVENLHRHHERTPITDSNRWQIVKQAASEVGPPLFFSLAIITLSFLPVFALQAQEGKLFAPLAYTKTFAMAAAAILTITLVPVLMGYLIRGRIRSEDNSPLNRALVAIYRPIINGVLKHPKKVLTVALLLVLLGFWPLTKIGSEFMPPLDEGDLMYMPTTYAAISVGKARELLQQTDRLIKTVPEVKTVFGKIGRAETATDPAPLTMIETVVQLHPREQWREGMTPEKLRAELDQITQLPGVSNAWVMPIKTRIDMLATGIKTPLGVKIAGPDLDVIQSIGAQLETILAPIEGTASVYSERVAGGRYINIDINRLQATRYGLNIADLQEVIQTAIGGINLTETIEGQQRFPVNLRYPQSYRDSVEQLQWLPIVTPRGERIALADVATLVVSDGPPMIKSENARINGWTLVDIEGRDLGSYVAEARERVSEALSLPPGYSLNWSGQYEYMERAKQRLQLVVPLTLAIIVLLLYMNFRHWDEVVLILITLPFSLIGGLWFIYWAGYMFSVAVVVGFIALAGVAVETGVLMLTYLKQRWQQSEKEQGALKQAVIEGAGLRVRPIVMTTATIVIGLLPIMWGDATGASVMQRIASPMIGGMLTTLLLTLVVLPAAFYLWKRY